MWAKYASAAGIPAHPTLDFVLVEFNVRQTLMTAFSACTFGQGITALLAIPELTLSSWHRYLPNNMEPTLHSEESNLRGYLCSLALRPAWP